MKRKLLQTFLTEPRGSESTRIAEMAESFFVSLLLPNSAESTCWLHQGVIRVRRVSPLCEGRNCRPRCWHSKERAVRLYADDTKDTWFLPGKKSSLGVIFFFQSVVPVSFSGCMCMQLCPFSFKWLQEQLQPVIDAVTPSVLQNAGISINPIPFGNTQEIPNDKGGYDYICQVCEAFPSRSSSGYVQRVSQKTRWQKEKSGAVP